MFLIKIYCLCLLITLVFSRTITRIDAEDDQDLNSNIYKVKEPVVFEDFEEMIELNSLSTETPKALKEKLSFMDMVVLLALWNKEREFNNYNNGPFADHKSVAPINFQ